MEDKRKSSGRSAKRSAPNSKSAHRSTRRGANVTTKSVVSSRRAQGPANGVKSSRRSGSGSRTSRRRTSRRKSRGSQRGFIRAVKDLFSAIGDAFQSTIGQWPPVRAVADFFSEDAEALSDKERELQAEENYNEQQKKKAQAKKNNQKRVRSLYEFLSDSLKKTHVRIILAAAVLLLLLYLPYQAYLRYYSSVETVTATVSTYTEYIETEGISIRTETVLDAAISSTSVAAVDSGDKVASGETVINVFSSSGAAEAYARITEIDEEISNLENMSATSEDSALEVEKIEMQLDEQIGKLASSVNSGDLDDISEIRSQITYLMNKRLTAMHKVDGYESRIEELTAEKEELEQKYSETPSTVTSPSSGYYVSSVDGYEDSLDVSMLSELTATELSEIMSAEVETDSSSAGKIIENFEWYLACPISTEEAEILEVGTTYTLLLPYSETGSLKAELVYLNEDDSENVLAIFECTSLLSELCEIRSQPVQIQTKSYTGFRIDKSALRAASGTAMVSLSDTGVSVEGEETSSSDIESYDSYPYVYILIGNQVYLRRVSIIYSGDDFVICSSSQTSSSYLALYDEIITEGKGLYEGKLVS